MPENLVILYLNFYSCLVLLNMAENLILKISSKLTEIIAEGIKNKHSLVSKS